MLSERRMGIIVDANFTSSVGFFKFSDPYCIIAKSLLILYLSCFGVNIGPFPLVFMEQKQVSYCNITQDGVSGCGAYSTVSS